MSKTIRPLFSWRAAICKSDLDSSTKLVLFALSFHMNEIGASCFPTQEQLSQETSLSIRTVRDAILNACKLGWIKRELHGFGGQRWKNYQYQASIPVIHKGPATIAAPSKKDRQLTTEGPANERKKDRQPLPLSTPLSTSVTLQESEKNRLQNISVHLASLKSVTKQ